MNTNKTALGTRFAAETRFELRPALNHSFRAAQAIHFERLKSKLLAERLQDASARWSAPLRCAANDAAALAWTTLYPLLVFPALFEEKIADTVRQVNRQARILRRNQELIAG